MKKIAAEIREYLQKKAEAFNVADDTLDAAKRRAEDARKKQVGSHLIDTSKSNDLKAGYAPDGETQRKEAEEKKEDKEKKEKEKKDKTASIIRDFLATK